MKQILEHLLAKIRTIQEEMDNGQEEMEGQVGSLTCWIHVKKGEMKTYPGELQPIAVHQEVPKEEAMVETIGPLVDHMGIGI
jgi:hypothetical protein